MEQVCRLVALSNLYVCDRKDIKLLNSLEDLRHFIYDVDQSFGLPVEYGARCGSLDDFGEKVSRCKASSGMLLSGENNLLE